MNNYYHEISLSNAAKCSNIGTNLWQIGGNWKLLGTRLLILIRSVHNSFGMVCVKFQPSMTAGRLCSNLLKIAALQKTAIKHEKMSLFLSGFV